MMARALCRACIVFALCALGGCATVPQTAASRDDPFEPWNRAMYDVHQVVDGHFIKPIAQAYVDVTPRLIQQGIHNFFQNLDDFVSIVNDYLQGDLNRAGNDTGRVMINSFFGLGGIIDIASEAGIERGDQDFGLTFGKWGIAQGPYLFIPVLGPTTVRDGTQQRASNHFFPPGAGAEPLAGAAPPLAVPASAALLNRNWPMRFSSTTADCVCLMTSPAAKFFSSPPGSMPTYWSPSRPAVRILAELSRGNSKRLSRSSVTTPWKLLPSKEIPVTRPTVTPALRTGARTLRPPMLSNRACNW
jgi:hypothetical protein